MIKNIYLPLLFLFGLLLFFLFLGYRGLNYWIDVTTTTTQARIDIPVSGVGTIDVYYPEAIRLNPEEKKELVFELTPLKSLTRTLTTTVTLNETSPYIFLEPQQFEMLAGSSSSQSERIEIKTYNLRSPPASVNVSVETMVAGAQTGVEENVKIPIDNWTWRLAASFGVCLGIVSFLAALAAILSAFG